MTNTPGMVMYGLVIFRPGRSRIVDCPCGSAPNTRLALDTLPTSALNSSVVILQGEFSNSSGSGQVVQSELKWDEDSVDIEPVSYSQQRYQLDLLHYLN